jgi:hypothetical protein
MSNVRVCFARGEKGGVPSLSEMASAVHAAVASLDVEKVMDFYSERFRAGSKIARCVIAVPRGFSCVTSWRAFDVYGAIFGERPRQFVFPSPDDGKDDKKKGLNWLGVIVGSPIGRGAKLYLNIPAALKQQAQDWNWKDTDAKNYKMK